MKNKYPLAAFAGSRAAFHHRQREDMKKLHSRNKIRSLQNKQNQQDVQQLSMEEKIATIQGKLLDMEKEQTMLSDSYQQLSVKHAETNEKCEIFKQIIIELLRDSKLHAKTILALSKTVDEYIDRNDCYVDGLAYLATSQARAVARAQECFGEGNEDDNYLHNDDHHSSTMHNGEGEEEDANLLRAINNDKFKHAQEWLKEVQGNKSPVAEEDLVEKRMRSVPNSVLIASDSSSLHDYTSRSASAEHTVADGPLLELSEAADDDLPDDTTEHDLEAFGIQVPEEWMSDAGVI